MKSILLDVILFALFTAELCFHFMPKILHEIFGVALAAVILLHIFVNRRRLAMMKKKLTPRRIVLATVDLALIICAEVTLITGICISNYIFSGIMSLEIHNSVLIHQIHVAAPYAMMILIGVHFGLNWYEFLYQFLNLFGLTDIYQRHKILFVAEAFILSAIGIVGLFFNQVGDRILMKHIFATPATDLPAPVFILLIFSGVEFVALVTFLLDKKFFAKGG
ncbi:MAG: DUF4405 domain-containing protein [Selenomonadaceae bacterium]|nr:DUF4405 domain-containing protein [Selenomonadaceae bacterium]